VTDDHYTTLGVLPTSDDSVVRAAYLALMRQYHPDKNASPVAVERARSIIAAFNVVGDPERRLHYDWERRRAADEAAAGGWQLRLSQPMVAALAFAVLLATLAFAWPALRTPLAGTDASSGEALAGQSANQECVSPDTRERLRRDLIARAARLGGGGKGFDRMAADVRMQFAAPGFAKQDSVEGTVECTAAVTVSLPDGARFPTGQRVLVADLDYAVRLAALDAPKQLFIGNRDLIAGPLAAVVTSVRPQVPAPDLSDFPPPPDQIERREVPSASAPQPMRPLPVRAEQAPVRATPAVPRPAVRATPPARPVTVAARTETQKPPAPASTDRCGAAGTGAAAAICRDNNLASLDRNSKAFYDQSFRVASDARRASLAQSRAGFIARREACRSEACLRSVHLGHMRDVAAVVEGRAK